MVQELYVLSTWHIAVVGSKLDLSPATRHGQSCIAKSLSKIRASDFIGNLYFFAKTVETWGNQRLKGEGLVVFEGTSGH